ncbi:mATE efflux family protein [Bacteroides clarus CAG:160]|nr:mATE efflux family protein [Bacteroides clarus CAG:160]
MLRNGDLTQGGITSTLLRFTLPMMAGSLLQQCYNIADTLIVGQCIGADALAAVGSAYTLMVFLISVLLGLSIGSGTVFSLHYGAGNSSALRRSIFVSFVLIGAVTFLLNVAAFVWLDPILRLLQVPQDIYGMMRSYLWIIFCGIVFTFIYNFYAALLRAVGDSVTPLWFLAVSVVLNIVLDLFFILQLGWGIEGAAIATVIAQGAAAAGILLYTCKKRPELRLHREDMHFDRCSLKEIVSFSTLTCVQQSVMNFGILMIQGLVNSFGTAVMAVRSSRYGGLCCRCKDRLLRIYARTGVRKCFLHFHCAEFRGETLRTYSPGCSQRVSHYGYLFAYRLRSCIRLCGTADADFRSSERDGNPCYRSGISAYRGCVLLWHRHPFPALRLLSRYPQTGDVGRAYGDFVRYPRRAFLYTRRHSFHRGNGHLVGYSHRLAAGRCGRSTVL